MSGVFRSKSESGVQARMANWSPKGHSLSAAVCKAVVPGTGVSAGARVLQASCMPLVYCSARKNLMHERRVCKYWR